jgi:RNA polymerase sigma factor (TIGR02999 family)
MSEPLSSGSPLHTHACPAPGGPVTNLLVNWSNGDPEALNRLMPLVYHELRRLARYHLRGSPDSTLQPTVLVHEAYLRLCKQQGVSIPSRTDFNGIVAHLMRCVLVDHARRKSARKRQAGIIRVSVETAEGVAGSRDPDIIALDDALTSLAKIDPEKCQIVELRFFGGLSVDEIAVLVGLSSRTVARQWALAKAWLYGELLRHKNREADQDP